MNVEAEPRTYCCGRGGQQQGGDGGWGGKIFFGGGIAIFLRSGVTKSFEAWVVKDFWKVTAK